MIIGTAGHIDHGKTALVRALTGVDTDRLAEEKARGISIDLGFAYLPTAAGDVLGFVDVPGHERFIRNMLAGATGIDFVLLVVAADDGVMQQTREHLAIVDLLGLTQGIVALTKADLADAPQRAEAAAEITQALAGTALAGASIVPVSTVTGEGIDELRMHLLAAAQIHHSGPARGRFRLAVDRAFTLTGVGTIVTGTVQSGSVGVGDRIVVSPAGLTARVRSIHAQGRSAARGRAGERCALNLTGDNVGKDAITRGDIVMDPALHAPTQRIDATLRVLASEPAPIPQWLPARLHHAATEVGARVVLLGDAIALGSEGRVQLVLDRPIAAACGDRFVLRDTSAQRTIGGGRFLDLRAPQRRRRSPERQAQLDAHAQRDPAAALAALLTCPPHHVDLGAFGRDRALTAAELAEISEMLAIVQLANAAGVTALAQASWQLFKQSVTTALAAFHAGNPDVPGMSLDRLRPLILTPRLPPAAFAAAVQLLGRERAVSLDGAFVRLPTHALRLKPEDDKLWQRIRPLLSDNERFRPPRVGDIAKHLHAPEPKVRQLMKLLAKLGQVDEIAPDHFFLRTTLVETVAIAADIARQAVGQQLTAAQLRDRLDNGRKVAIQILEFLDRHGVTLRNGDLRRMNKAKLNLFGPLPELPVPQAGKAASGGEASPVGRPDFKSGRGR